MNIREKILIEIFSEMESYGLKYCIMNGKDEIIESKSDIDIAVDSIERFNSCLCKLKKKDGVRLVQMLEHGYKSINYFVLYKGELISFDVYEVYSAFGRVFFEGKYFIKDRKPYNFFYIPSPEKEFVYYTVKKVIKGDVDGKFSVLTSMFESLDRKFSANYLKTFFPKSYEQLYEALKEKDKPFFLSQRKSLQKELLLSRLVSLKVLLGEVRRIVKRILNPTGLIIAFLGPDGAGKSTVINQLKKEELPFRRIDYFHLKPRIFDKKGNGKPVINPHAKPPHKGVKSYLKLCYFAVNYIVGYFMKIFPLKIRSSLIIFDRYYDDIFIDPKRYRYDGSLKVAMWLKKFIPRPDVYIILTSDPQVIYQRKQEVDFEELKRQIKEHEKLIDNKKYFKVDASQSPDAVTEEVIRIILKKLGERFEK